MPNSTEHEINSFSFTSSFLKSFLHSLNTFGFLKCIWGPRQSAGNSFITMRWKIAIMLTKALLHTITKVFSWETSRELSHSCLEVSGFSQQKIFSLPDKVRICRADQPWGAQPQLLHQHFSDDSAVAQGLSASVCRRRESFSNEISSILEENKFDKMLFA